MTRIAKERIGEGLALNIVANHAVEITDDLQNISRGTRMFILYGQGRNGLFFQLEEVPPNGGPSFSGWQLDQLTNDFIHNFGETFVHRACRWGIAAPLLRQFILDNQPS